MAAKVRERLARLPTGEYPLRLSAAIVALSFLSYLVLHAVWSLLPANDFGFYDHFLQWDSGWYLSIVTGGYMEQPLGNGQANWAFFPLYPFTVRVLRSVTGLGARTAALLLSNLYLFGAIAFAYRYLRETRNRQVAFTAAVLLGFAPYTFYFSTVYSESLYVLLVAAGFYAVHRERWLAAGAVGGLLSATRGVGGLFGIVLLVGYYREYRRRDLSRGEMLLDLATDVEKLVAAALVPVGIAAFATYLYLHVGDPLAFVHVESAWGRQLANPLTRFVDGLQGRGFHDPVTSVYVTLWGLVGVITAAYLARRERVAEAAFLLVTLLVPASSSIQSLPRYVVGSLVFFFALAEVVERFDDHRWPLLGALAAVNAGFVVLWFDRAVFLT